MRVCLVGVLAESVLTFRGELLREMVAAGHEVLALAPDDDPVVRSALVQMGVQFETYPLRRTGLNPLVDLRSMWALFRRFRRFRTDAVLVYAAKPVVYGSFAARLARVPHRAAMITGAGSAMRGGPGPLRTALASVLRALYVLALRGDHVVFFQNPDDERLFRALGMIGPGQRVLRINGSGVDLTRFSEQPLPAPPIRFLMLARLIRDKGVAEYHEAARLVRARRPDVRVQLLGSLDPNPSAISAGQLAAWQAEGVVEYLGSTRDVRPFLADAHVCVLPSYGEGMPRSILEAMAMGRAIVTTDVPGCRETVVEGENGFLVRPRDAVSLADAMLRVVEDPERLASMGRASRRLAEERFDVRDVNRKILDGMMLT